jgi:hypothetical protein
VKTPQWLAQKIAETGVLVLDGKMSRAEADAAVIAATREHPEYGEELAAASIVALFGRWLRDHSSSGDLFQAQMFPGLPAVLVVAPKRKVGVADMTRADLDHAKNMLYARTGNAIDGAKKAAEAERAAFDAFYDKVCPLLTDGKTVGDVLGALASEGAV